MFHGRLMENELTGSEAGSSTMSESDYLFSCFSSSTIAPSIVASAGC
jgi:hypothetical protein